MSKREADEAWAFHRALAGEQCSMTKPHYEASRVDASAPKRIQRKRTRGWKMPPNTVYVGRPTKWGNPWTPEKYWDAGYSGSVEVATKHCVEAYKAWLLGREHWAHPVPVKPTPDLTELRGKNLSCWCPLDQPCHADVLLEIVNGKQEAADTTEEQAIQVAVERGSWA